MIKKVDKIFGQRVSNKILFKPSVDRCPKNGKPAYYERTTELGTKIRIINPQWDMTKKLIFHHNGLITTVFNNNYLLKQVQKERNIFDMFINKKWAYDLEHINAYLKEVNIVNK